MIKKEITHIKKAIVIGASAGGIDILSKLIPAIDKHNKTPIYIAQHISANSNSYFIKYLNEISNVTVYEAAHGENTEPGAVYIAPPDYHLLIEEDFTLSLSKDAKVNYSRPSIDVLFETAADAFSSRLTGIILTGANSDGSQGLKRIKECGGFTIVQDPKTAEATGMPTSAIAVTKVDAVLGVDELVDYFRNLK